MRPVFTTLIAVFALAGCLAPSGQAESQPSFCTPEGKQRLLRHVPEASGIAVSRRLPGSWWTLNDSGEPLLFRFDAQGGPTAVRIGGAEIRDWEALALAGCPAGDCLYIGDIGDNRAVRRHITVYRVPEPSSADAKTATADALHARYADGARDAEALLMLDGRLFIVTKETPGRVYRFPTSLTPGTVATLELVRTLDEKTRITGGAVSPDGKWVALRSKDVLLLYKPEQFVGGGAPIRIDLASLEEPQGEGVAFGQDGKLYLASEGGGGRDSAAGVLTRLNCTLPD